MGMFMELDGFTQRRVFGKCNKEGELRWALPLRLRLVSMIVCGSIRSWDM